MIVLDCETTGLYPRKNSIVSIGAVEFYNSNNMFYEECKICEGAEIEQKALDINGFTKEQITDPNKKSLEQILTNFLKWIEPCSNITLAGENPRFDIDFLNAATDMYGIRFRFGHRSIDLHSLCIAHHMKRGIILPLKNNKSDLNTDKILNYVGLPEEPKPHHALTGAKMEAEAFSRLIYGKNLLDEFSKFDVPRYLKIQI